MPFGQHLIDRGVITPQQLVEALEAQRLDQIPVGEIAIAKGYLSYREVTRILALRVDDRHASDLFGDVAVELGLLTREQVEELLEDQRVTRMPLGEFLVRNGALSEDRLEAELREYRTPIEA
ncbi:MAG: hypothetical protein KDC38_15260 [Planctomycetes bacterium]|nr:hypothetical protein [Planctomycetota bacterium]